MIEGIKVFGERNCGNNYLMHLLDTNLALKHTTRAPHINKAMGWTHGTPKIYDADTIAKTLFVITVKNPYSWLLSLRKKPHTKKTYKNMKFGRFVMTSMESHRSPVDMWNYKYAAYLWFVDTVKHACVVKYEDVLKNPQGVIDDIWAKFDLSRSDKYFTPINNTTHPSGKVTNQLFGKKKYYLKELWAQELENIEYINNHLNKKVMKQLSYELR